MKEIIRVARAIIVPENIVGEKDKILLGKRAQNVEVGAGLMEIPGGKVDLGEDPEIAVVREVKEELSLGFVPIDLFKRYTDTGADGTEYDNFIFWGRATGKLRPNPKEVESAGFFSENEIFSLKMAFKQEVPVLEFLGERKKGKFQILNVS